MKKLHIGADDTLNKVDSELIGNGGNSRLCIMLDKSTGEVWSDEFYDHEQNSWKDYSRDGDVVWVGRAINGRADGDDEGDGCGFWWQISIYSTNEHEDPNYISGDSWNDGYSIDTVLEAIHDGWLQEAGDEGVYV